MIVLEIINTTYFLFYLKDCFSQQFFAQPFFGSVQSGLTDNVHCMTPD